MTTLQIIGLCTACLFLGFLIGMLVQQVATRKAQEGFTEEWDAQLHIYKVRRKKKPKG